MKVVVDISEEELKKIENMLGMSIDDEDEAGYAIHTLISSIYD